DVVDLSKSIYLAKEEFKEVVKKYEEYLKVAGNNYKYPYIHQISIYNMDTKATACAEFDYWKSVGRSVKRGEKGIPLLDMENGKIKYIFDIRQTVSIDHNISEVKLWEYDSKKHLSLLDELIDKFKEKDSQLLLSQDDKIDGLADNYVRGKFNEALEGLSDESLKAIQKLDLFNLLKESVKISISERMGVSYNLKEEKLSILSKISSPDIDKVLSISSNLSKNILLDLGREIKRLEISEKFQENEDREQTKGAKERYNKSRSDIDNHINEEINLKEGGLEDERESNTSRQGISHGRRNLHTSNQGESLRETGRDIQDGRDGRRGGSPSTQYGNAWGNRSEETQSLGKDEVELSQGEQGRGLSDNVSTRKLDGSSPIQGERDRGLYQQGRSQDDGSLGTNRGTEGRGLSEIPGTEKEHGHDPTRDRRKGNNLNLKNEEVESTSFFSANNQGEQIFITSPISQREIDIFLIYGGNHQDGRLPVIAEFSKGKTLEEEVNFLKETYKGANGFEIDGRNISVWFGEEGAIFQEGDGARYRGGQVFSWEDIAVNINKLLDRGEFASNVEVIESASYERGKIAESLWYLKRDFSDEVKDNYLPSLNEIRGSGFPEETENLGKKLEDKNFRSELKKEYETFLEDYKNNPNILRFHHHKIDRIYQDFSDLELERKEYHSNMTEIEPINTFITQDEIDENLRGASGFSEGKKRIVDFFKEKHSLKDQADFLKNEYGIGGGSPALSGARGSGEWHDAKGIRYNKGNAKEIQLSWSNVARRINDLIEKNRYMDIESIEEDRGKKVDHDIYNVKDIKTESQEPINYQEDLPPTDSEVYTEKTNNISTYYYQGQSVASIGENGRLVIYDEFMPNFLKEDLYSLAYEKQLDSSLDQLEDGIVLEGIRDTFYIKDKERLEGKDYYLLESQSRYDDIPNIIVNSSKEVIDDDIVNGFEEFKEFYTSKDKESIGLDQDKLIENEKDYWIVEFNEGSNLIEKNYAGQRLSKELLDEIREIDEKIRHHNKTLGEDEYRQMTDEWEGYSKFYFDHIVDGKRVDHYRIDIGDGNEVNQRDFQYLYEQIGKSQIELNQTIEESKIDDRSMDSIKVGDIVKTKDNKYLRIKNLSDGYDENDNPIIYYSYDAYFDKDLKLFSHSFKESNLKVVEILRDNPEEELAKEIVEDKVAVKVGYYYALVDREKTKDIGLEETGSRVYPRKDNPQGKVYTLYKGKSFEESQKIDSLFDEMASQMKDVNLRNLNDVFTLEKEGLFEISDDEVTSFKEGYDIDVRSLGQQFPDYYNDLYVLNKNLEINGAYQNLAYISRENEITFNVDLSQEEKAKIEEIRDKKEVLSKLIEKDIKEKREYYFDPQSEEYYVLTKKIEDGLLKNPDSIKDTIEGKEGFEVELVLDTKEKALKQNLRYNGYILKTNPAIKYKSYKDLLNSLPYLLDDRHREVLLEGYLNQQIENERQEESILKEGMNVRYQGKEYTIANINDKTSPKTIELEDSTGLMNGFITGSETILFNDYKDLDLEVIEENVEHEKDEVVRQISFGDFIDNKEEEKTQRENLNIQNKNKESKLDKEENKSKEIGEISLENYKILEEEESLPPSQRLKNNIEAISLLKTLEKENRPARKEEQEILAKYLGWGGLADIFDEEKQGQWLDARNFLKENLTGEEYSRARESTLTAFYTPKLVIDSIYESLSNLGFEKGNILEPSAGTGRFIGSLPEEMKESNFYGVELDRISGQIAKHLYPNANIQVKGFEETNFSNNLFDVAIGNIPFGEFKVADREYERNNFLIHDYFFAKTLDKVRDGGIIAFITSSGTMDKKSEDIRRYISERAEFLGAIRLPNTTFKGVAGTEVTSDIIFLKKRDRL
ncbi:MAG: conjugal transfer protein, partial [Tissierellia bacterium]|nr:conjugal transfer protein [Tissierellia bacterium]